VSELKGDNDSIVEIQQTVIVARALLHIHHSTRRIHLDSIVLKRNNLFAVSIDTAVQRSPTAGSFETANDHRSIPWEKRFIPGRCHAMVVEVDQAPSTVKKVAGDISNK